MATVRRSSKRVKLSLRSSKSYQRPSAHADNTERVFDVLSSGAIAFLTLREALRVLSTCRLLREDAALAVMALSHTDLGIHLLNGCASDMTHMPPPDALMEHHRSLFFGGCALNCRRMRVDPESGDVSDNRVINHAFLEDPRFAKNGRYATQLLSMIGMVQERLLPLCYDYVGLNKFGDLFSARPMLLPLAGYEQNHEGSDTQKILDKWTPDDVKNALNSRWNVFGDDFTSPPSKYVHVSDVGAHWENISVSKRGGKSTSCAFCDAANKAVRDYRKEAHAMLKTFSEVLNAKKQKWRAKGYDAEEIHQKRSELKSRFFPEDSYPDVNFADSHEDDILADICESDRFPMDPFEGMAMGFDRASDDVFNALSEPDMKLCKSLYQPLKKLLTEQLALVGARVHRSWMNDEDGTFRSELIAGVSSSGFLCGVFVTVKRAEYELPSVAGLEEEDD